MEDVHVMKPKVEIQSSGQFPRTMRSAVLGVHSEDPKLRARAWDRLSRAYYRPVYKYVRVRWHKQRPDAEELTQGFFQRCLEKETFIAYDPAKARFRTFVRSCLDHFVQDDHRIRNAAKRGGAGVRAVVDIDDIEGELALEGAAGREDLEAYFDEAWVRQVLAMAIDALRRRCESSGKQAHLAIFEKYHLQSEEPPSYAAIAEELGLSVTDVTNRLAWARRQFRRCALEILRQLTASDEEYRSEARLVLGVEA